MINRVVLVGRMTKDPDIRYTGNGTAVTNFTIALNRFGAQEGQQQADYINCVVWNKVAQSVADYCSKGSLVGIDGRLQSRSYDNQQGQKVYVTEVLCNSVQFLDTRKKEETQKQQDSTYNQPKQDQYYDNPFDEGFSSFDINDDDIQF